MLLPGLLLLVATSTAPPDDLFAEAEGLLGDLRAAEALELLEARLVEGKLGPAELTRLWSLKGRALGVIGQGAKAQEAFSVALRVDPEWRLPAGEADPEITGPYHAALAVLPARSKSLSVWLRLEAGDDRSKLRYQLVADDLGLVSGAEVQAGDVVREVALSLDDVPRELALPAGTGAIAFRLLDAHGNALRDESLEVAATTSGEVSSQGPGGRRWLALGGGTTMALGALGVMVSGIGIAAIDDGQKAPDGTKDVLLGGVLAATGLVVVGGALIATDFLLDPP